MNIPHHLPIKSDPLGVRPRKQNFKNPPGVYSVQPEFRPTGLEEGRLHFWLFHQCSSVIMDHASSSILFCLPLVVFDLPFHRCKLLASTQITSPFKTLSEAQKRRRKHLLSFCLLKSKEKFSWKLPGRCLLTSLT